MSSLHTGRLTGMAQTSKTGLSQRLPLKNHGNTRHLRLACRSDAQVSHNGIAHQNVSAHDRRTEQWQQKSDMYLMRSDGFSCAREVVNGTGSIQFEHPTSQQQLLVWKTKPSRVLVLKKLGPELMPELIDVLQYLGFDQSMQVVVEPADYEAMQASGAAESMPWVDTYTEADIPHLHNYIDFVVCLGGDGLILHAAYLFGTHIPPIVSFRLGSMGFLTCHDYSDYPLYLNDVINGSHELATCRLTNSVDGSPLLGMHITLRMRLQCDIYRNGRLLENGRHLVMNEVVLSRGAQPYLSKIEVYERDVLITKVQADGVMLATPTGSTAYSVAAGGSMVHPNVPAILFTPICPHSLSFRPVILPDYAELELRISEGARSNALATFDGKAMIELLPGDSVHVKLSPYPVPTINNTDQTVDWFGSVDRCFNWNNRMEQKDLSEAQKKELLTRRAPASA